jgi:hypothetical protein
MHLKIIYTNQCFRVNTPVTKSIVSPAKKIKKQYTLASILKNKILNTHTITSYAITNNLSEENIRLL